MSRKTTICASIGYLMTPVRSNRTVLSWFCLELPCFVVAQSHDRVHLQLSAGIISSCENVHSVRVDCLFDSIRARISNNFYMVSTFQNIKLEALGQCIPPPRHVLPVPPSGESLWAADLCALTTFHISQSRKTIPVSRRWSGSPPKCNHLFTGPLPIFPENFMQIRLEIFAQSC